MKDLIKGIWKNSGILEKILYIYVALLPFTDLCYLHFGAKRAGWAELVFLWLLILWLIKYVGKKIGLRKISLDAPVALMVVLFSISFFNSRNLLDSILEMSGLVYLIMLLCLIVSVISDQQKLRDLLSVVFITGSAIALAGLAVFAGALVTGKALGNPFLHYTMVESLARCFPRIKFVFESPNMMLSYLHVALVAGMIFFLSEKKAIRRFLIALVIVIILLASFLTGSRSFAGILLTLLMVQFWFGKGRLVSFLKYLTIAGFIFFLTVSIINTVWAVFPVEIRKDSDEKLIELKASYAYSIHFIRPVASINMFKKHPVIGVGFGTYNRNFRDNVDWDWFRQSFDFNAYPEYLSSVENKTLSFDPHSVFLGSLAETGLLGFLGLMYFFIAYMAMLIKRFRNSEKHSFQNIVYGCILAGFIGFLSNGANIDILSMRHFWFMMAIGVVSYEG